MLRKALTSIAEPEKLRDIVRAVRARQHDGKIYRIGDRSALRRETAFAVVAADLHADKPNKA